MKKLTNNQIYQEGNEKCFGVFLPTFWLIYSEGSFNLQISLYYSNLFYNIYANFWFIYIKICFLFYYIK